MGAQLVCLLRCSTSECYCIKGSHKFLQNCLRQVWFRSLLLALVRTVPNNTDPPPVPIKELRALAAILSRICPLYVLLVTSATMQHCGRSLATLFPKEMATGPATKQSFFLCRLPQAIWTPRLPLPSGSYSPKWCEHTFILHFGAFLQSYLH